MNAPLTRSQHITSLRARSAYPTFRLLCNVALVFGYLSSALSALGGGLMLLDGKLPAAFAAIFSALVLVLIVRVSYESLMMLADAADCLIDQTMPRA